MWKIALLVLVYFTFEIATSRTNFEIMRFEFCDGIRNVFPFNGNVTKKADGYQYFNGNMTLTVPLDDNVGTIFIIYNKLFGQFRELFVIREKSFCLAANMYLGEFWYDLQRAAQIMPGACPVRAGKYHVNDFKLRFEKISLQTFSFGRLRFIWNVVDNRKNDQILLCLLIEVNNIELQ